MLNFLTAIFGDSLVSFRVCKLGPSSPPPPPPPPPSPPPRVSRQKREKKGSFFTVLPLLFFLRLPNRKVPKTPSVLLPPLKSSISFPPLASFWRPLLRALPFADFSFSFLPLVFSVCQKTLVSGPPTRKPKMLRVFLPFFARQENSHSGAQDIPSNIFVWRGRRGGGMHSSACVQGEIGNQRWREMRKTLEGKTCISGSLICQRGALLSLPLSLVLSFSVFLARHIHV